MSLSAGYGLPSDWVTKPAPSPKLHSYRLAHTRTSTVKELPRRRGSSAGTTSTGTSGPTSGGISTVRDVPKGCPLYPSTQNHPGSATSPRDGFIRIWMFGSGTCARASSATSRGSVLAPLPADPATGGGVVGGVPKRRLSARADWSIQTTPPNSSLTYSKYGVAFGCCCISRIQDARVAELISGGARVIRRPSAVSWWMPVTSVQVRPESAVGPVALPLEGVELVEATVEIAPRVADGRSESMCGGADC